MRSVKVGVYYCVRHEGIANEDDAVCDFSRMEPTDTVACDFRRLYYRAKR